MTPHGRRITVEVTLEGEALVSHAGTDQPRPELATSDSDSRWVLTDPTPSNRSICSSISADGGTVHLTA